MKYSKNVYRTLMMISQFGINMLVPIFACSFAGMYIDRALDTNFFMIILFFLGAFAGFRNIYVLTMKLTNYNDKEERRNAGKHKDVSEKK